MRKDHYLSIRDIIKGMKPDEIKVARNFIVSFDSNVAARANKSLQLFNLLIERPDTPREKAKAKVSTTINESSFDRMLKRLKEKILESLILGVNIDRRDAYSDFFRQKFRVRKLLMEAMIINGRGVKNEAQSIMNKVILISKKYELYDELVETLQYKDFMTALNVTKQSDRKKVQKEIEFYKFCREALLQCIHWYYRYFTAAEKTGIKKKNLSLLREAIQEMQESYNQTQSANIAYFLYTLLMEYYQQVGDYRRSLETGLTLAREIENNPAIYVEGRLGSVYKTIGQHEQYIFEFESSIEHAKLSQKYFKKIKFNLENAQELEVWGLYYNNQLDEALDHINYLIGITNGQQFPFHYSRRNYIKACILFALGNFRECNLLLHETRELDRDREGWNIGIRMLSIMSHIEQGQLDNADAQIESLRKHISRVKKEHPVSLRTQTILRILQKLDKVSYEYDQVWGICGEEIEKLSSSKQGYAWSVRIPELIVFHHWIAAKVSGKKYQFRVPEELKETSGPDKYEEFAMN